jgi:hypothetical protein
MGTLLVIPLIIMVLALSGFIFLAMTMWTARESRTAAKGAGKGNFFAGLGGNQPLPHSNCYEQCMEDAKWDSNQVPKCTSTCGD